MNDQPQDQVSQPAPAPSAAPPLLNDGGDESIVSGQDVLPQAGPHENESVSSVVDVPVSPQLTKQLNAIPPEANDVDVIEKEWVNHLKDIAARTADNPYMQQSEISLAKADYLKKRYNKDVKIAED